MKQPPFLQSGNTIAITATARKVSLQEIEPAIQLFSAWGLNVKLAEGLFAEQHQFAGSDDTRASALQQLLDDPTVNAIICARGGYGTVRIIDQLDFTKFSQSPKWLIGFSDVTVLHNHVYRHCQVHTIHAPMAFSMQPSLADAESIESLRQLLFGHSNTYTTPIHPLNRNGIATGKLVGGNLSVLNSVIGSVSDINTEGCVLFLEDLDEYVYHIDRMMMNLKRNGKLDKLAGLMVGGMNDMKDNTISFGKSAEQIIAEHVSEFSYPVSMGFAAGHERKNLALMMGQTYSLKISSEGTILQIA